MATTLEKRLGQILIKKRWCSLRKLNRLFEIQDGLKEKGTLKPLEVLLIEQDLVEADRVLVALAELGVLRLYCEDCDLEVPISTHEPGAGHPCPQCQAQLVLDEAHAPTRRDPAGSFHAKAKGSFRSRDVFEAGASGDKESPSGQWQGSAAELPEEEDPITRKIVGGCQVINKIARGGMGVVYKAKQLKLGRTVAVKILSEDLARDRSFVHRFLQEARAAAELNHGNIVHIFDVGELNGIFYIIMEYVDGRNLREILEECSTLSVERALEICLQASHALRHAHQRGVIHRDIKPENIMITRDETVKIADLGLAKKIASGEQDGGITSAGAILGTPYYMAPEQVKDFSKVDGRTDIYSLGVTLYRALAGVVPFKGRTPVEVMIQVVDGKRPSLRSVCPDVPEEVELLVDKMMHRRPESRFQDFSEVVQEMESVLYRLRHQALA